MKETRSAGGIVLNRKGEVAVVSQEHRSWSLPKGHVEPGETLEEAARREIEEETGLDELELVRAFPPYRRFRIAKDGGEDRSRLKIMHLFLFRTTQEGLAPKDPKNPEARWVPRDEVAELLTHPKDKEFFLGVKDQVHL